MKTTKIEEKRAVQYGVRVMNQHSLKVSGEYLTKKLKMELNLEGYTKALPGGEM